MHDRLVSQRIDALHQCFLATIFDRTGSKSYFQSDQHSH